MQWYYALNNQRQGPIGESDLQRLAAEGIIKGDTLVWRQGMEAWQPYSSVAATLGGAAAGDAAQESDDTAVCVVSGKRYPKREMVKYEGVWISAEHRDEYFQRLREGVAVPGQRTVPGPFGYGGFWKRFLARIVDGIIQWPVGWVLGAIIGLTGAVGTVRGVFAAQAAGILFGLAYEVFFIRKFDATPGKMAFGLKVLRSDGSKLSIGRIVGRYFGQWASAIILLIGYIMAAFDEEKRALHDRIADTRVIKTR